MEAVLDPWEEGFPDRIACTPAQIDERPNIDAIIQAAIALSVPLRTIDRMRYLLYHGYYTLEELMRYAPFADQIDPLWRARMGRCGEPLRRGGTGRRHSSCIGGVSW